MNIETSSVLSGLFTNIGAGTDQVIPSVTTSGQLAELQSLLSNIQPGMTIDSFTAALTQQLQLTKPKAAGETESTITLQAPTTSGLSNFFTPVESMQEISQLLGKQLPVAKKLETTQEIDLNQTMEALSAVLGRISNAVGTSTPPVDTHTTKKPLSQNIDETDSAEQVASTALLQPGTMSQLLPPDPVANTLPQEIPVTETTVFSSEKPDEPEDNTGTSIDTQLTPVSIENSLANLMIPPSFQAGKVESNSQASSTKSTSSSKLTGISNTTNLTSSLNFTDSLSLTGSSSLTGSLSLTGSSSLTSPTNSINSISTTISTDASNATKLADSSVNQNPETPEHQDNLKDFANTSVPLTSENLNPLIEKSQVNEVPNAIDQPIENNASRIVGDIQQLGQQLKSSEKVEQPTMSKHLYSPEWNQELGSKILWMNNQNMSSADIKLNPEHLGPITIRIDMHNEQANISFTAQNAGVREILEASIPKLREMFSAQQLNLADVNVSQQSFSGQQHQAASPYFQQGAEGDHQDRELTDESGTEATGANHGVTDEIMQSRAIATNGLVSLYA